MALRTQYASNPCSNNSPSAKSGGRRTDPRDGARRRQRIPTRSALSRSARTTAACSDVAIDPAVTSGEEADETGIIVAGKDKNSHG
jgi:hypothetical protein